VGEDVTHGPRESFVEAFGSGPGPSVDVVHLSSGNDDLRHVLFALPLFDRFCWEEVDVQDEKTISAELVRFGDELVGIHSVRSWSGEIAAVMLVIDVVKVISGGITYKV